MIFEKNGKRVSVTDPAHIDLYRAKGWKTAQEQQQEKQRDDIGDKGKEKK